jgi:prevent-host-death family protein
MEISAAQFKAKCLELMDRVHDFGEEILITKRGKVVARLCPVSRVTDDSFGCMKGTGAIQGDILETPRQDWEAEQGKMGS